MKRIKDVIDVFLGKKSAQKPASGKNLKASDELIHAIWKNEGSVVDFCEHNNLTRSKYYRIRNFRKHLKNKDDLKRLEELWKQR